MKFSVLLPTRDRLELLRYAVESVRRQDYADWEIVISDNDSSEDVAGYVRGLGDTRIRYVRTDRFVPVTENWNVALAHSAGDYVVTLGDDDCLLPGYFRALSELIDRYSKPDSLYVQAVQFAYPGVMPGHPDAFIQTGYCDFLRGREAPFLLSSSEARRAVRKSMAFRLPFSYNMQHSLVRRRFIQRLAPYGPFFQSPYPDYYASNVLLLTAESLLVVPEPLVAIGISPRSFGYYYFNERESEGNAFLNSLGPPEFAENKVLPGSTLMTCWFLAMTYIERNFGPEYGVRVDTDRYRFLQVLPLNRPVTPLVSLREHWPRLSASERIRFTIRLALFQLVPPLMPSRRRARFVERYLRRVSPFPAFDAKLRTVEYKTILELFENWPRTCGARA